MKLKHPKLINSELYTDFEEDSLRLQKKLLRLFISITTTSLIYAAVSFIAA